MAEKVSIPKEHSLKYECFKIERIPVDGGKSFELHAHTEGGRLVITDEKDANVIPKKDGAKWDVIEVHRQKVEVQ